MSRSVGEMADDILGGALSNPSKNPYDPNADKPLMDPGDKLVDISDSEREALIEGVVPEEERSSGFTITEEELEVLDKAKNIIEKIQEATTVGNLGVNFANSKRGKNPASVKIPGDVNVGKAKKRVRKSEPKNNNDFIAWMGNR